MIRLKLILAFAKLLPAQFSNTRYIESNEFAAAEEFFREDNWNDYAGLWIEHNDFLTADEDYSENLSTMKDEYFKSLGFTPDPRMPPQPAIELHPDAGRRVSHTVRIPPLPPGMAYRVTHCIAQSRYGPIYKMMYNTCADKKIDVARHSPMALIHEKKNIFPYFFQRVEQFSGVPGGFDQSNIRYVCKVGLCPLMIQGSCPSVNSCPESPPEMPPIGNFERKRFRKRGYLGLNRPHSVADPEYKPFGGFVKNAKTSFAHESEQELTKSAKFDFYLHKEELVYKNVVVNASTNETDLVRVYPETFDDIMLGIARHLYKTGVRIPQLIEMKIVASGDVLTTQPDFEEMSGFHEHSRERWQRKSETPKDYRRRINRVIKLAKRRELGSLKPHKAYRKFAGLLGAPTKPTPTEKPIQLQLQTEREIVYEDEREYDEEEEEEEEISPRMIKADTGVSKFGICVKKSAHNKNFLMESLNCKFFVEINPISRQIKMRPKNVEKAPDFPSLVNIIPQIHDRISKHDSNQK
ncbi:Oidioi.mRNA.OKI2018_I69.PAR.g8562.t1.cds [Oikopleura dioica]|uniref:Oidioi.mRNA.OKI2018_I69.PAR.g8562.t1.cds n=1 Tax=Oikopleura dioica TaxID=34765 RepID=A0ABN7RKZ9_OIKDI|nr:Oidioi.mRNA.OKI2018_I69.PAR.g8562.t1.cds [Oikopleura dioica]